MIISKIADVGKLKTPTPLASANIGTWGHPSPPKTCRRLKWMVPLYIYSIQLFANPHNFFIFINYNFQIPHFFLKRDVKIQMQFLKIFYMSPKFNVKSINFSNFTHDFRKLFVFLWVKKLKSCVTSHDLCSNCMQWICITLLQKD